MPVCLGGGMDGSKSEGETPSPRRSVATGASSWRQLSLDSLSSGGLWLACEKLTSL